MVRRVNTRKKDKQTVRVTPEGGRGGLKVCPRSLERIVGLANLSHGQLLLRLRFDFFQPVPGSLPDAVRLHLLEVANNPDEWQMTPEEWAAGFQSRVTLDEARDFLRRAAAADRYDLILGAREALTAVVEGKSVFPVTSFLKRGANGKAQYASDPISDALLEAELDYIKRCPICGKFFYAQRITQDACPLACANALRARRRRASEKVKRELAKKRKKKEV